MVNEVQTCANADCNFAVDGKCVEGLPLQDCPHLGALSEGKIENIESAADISEDVKPLIGLPVGDVLNRAAASTLLRRYASRVVGIIGPNDSGKTSLIASVYELLQVGPIADIDFAGSSTLIGFERVCHDARAASRRTAPYTERTSRGVDATFFHLDLNHSDYGLVSLMLGDRSGEDYLMATDEIIRADEYFELKRADCVVVLVNGDQLSNVRRRHETIAKSSQIIEALIESNTLRIGCNLACVLSKKDMVLASPKTERIRQDFGNIVSTISDKHSQHLGQIRSFEISASPRSLESVSRGEGVEDLLKFWIETPPKVYSCNVPRTVQKTRMIDLLTSEGESCL